MTQGVGNGADEKKDENEAETRAAGILEDMFMIGETKIEPQNEMMKKRSRRSQSVERIKEKKRKRKETRRSRKRRKPRWSIRA